MQRREWMATTSMRLDYFEPIVGPTFVIASTLEKKRGRTHFVVTKFLQDDERGRNHCVGQDRSQEAAQFGSRDGARCGHGE